MTSPKIEHDNGSVSKTLPFILLFFSSMIGHELALESLSTTYQFFPHMATSITLFQFGFCVLLPLVLSLSCTGGDAIKTFPRSFGQIWIYIKLSAIVYGATACATMSLTYEGVTYVTKVVFKSAKLIPTMIVGVVMDARAERAGKVVNKRKYGKWEYSSALLLCLGAAGFCMSPKDFGLGEEDETDAKPQEGTQSGQLNLGGHWIGISLLATSVFCDALVPNLQEQLMHGSASKDSALPSKNSCTLTDDDSDDENEMESLVNGEGVKQTQPRRNPTKSDNSAGGLSSQALMVNTNSVGFTLLLLSTICRRSFIPIVSFIATNPHFLVLHLTVGVGLGTAVLAYTELIRRSGPAVAVATATCKLLTYLFACLLIIAA